MEDSPSFGRILKDYRKALGLTQEQLAEQVSCSIETIKKIARHCSRSLPAAHPLMKRAESHIRSFVRRHDTMVQCLSSHFPY